ncbi:MAG: type II secretion system major pseudopilin GspG [Spirochaetia bacterium]|nr:type II secretion system major pseudopilin GspG [Spirochaetia bacterium]
MKIKNLKKRRGITLVELMVVIVVLGTLMTVLYFTIADTGITAEAKKVELKTAKYQLDAALFQFKQKFGRYPNADEGLEALVECPPGIEQSKFPEGGFLVNKNLRIDPWKRPYQYTTDGGKYQIISLGADGAVGGEGENADIDLSEF